MERIISAIIISLGLFLIARGIFSGLDRAAAINKGMTPQQYSVWMDGVR